MYIISYELPFIKVDKIIEELLINDIVNVFYESPLTITTDEFGYGYEEREDSIVILKVAFDGEEIDLSSFEKKTTEIVGSPVLSIIEENYTYDNFSIPAIHIDENWVLASPEEEFEGKNKINFISQGAFGTGLHETTQDILRYILNTDFSNKSVLDIGTGSGILSLAASQKNASEVIALDIRDVEDEVLLNASLNNKDNINVLVGDALSGEVKISGTFDWIFINIGGEETLLFMDLINNHLSPNGKLLISGLVEWSYEGVINKVCSHGYEVERKLQTNEWCTLILSKN
ncbi:MAG: 50S ribosomal protein L11 methyltransferase [Clostridium sp.]